MPALLAPVEGDPVCQHCVKAKRTENEALSVRGIAFGSGKPVRVSVPAFKSQMCHPVTAAQQVAVCQLRCN